MLYGLGCGFFDEEMYLRWGCGGTGASHGGYGGNSKAIKNENDYLCRLLNSRSPYGDKFHPILEGSGGGGWVMNSSSN